MLSPGLFYPTAAASPSPGVGRLPDRPGRCYAPSRGDLFGSLEGAGGIGGLLARSHGYSGGSWGTHNFYHADGGGSVTYLMTGAQGLAARYRYDPYGRLLSSSGSLAGANLYRFSSKEVNPNYPDAGGYYYFDCYRFSLRI